MAEVIVTVADGPDSGGVAEVVDPSPVPFALPTVLFRVVADDRRDALREALAWAAAGRHRVIGQSAQAGDAYKLRIW